MIEDEDNEDISKEETHLEDEVQEEMVCRDQEVIEAHEAHGVLQVWREDYKEQTLKIISTNFTARFAMKKDMAAYSIVPNSLNLFPEGMM